MYFKTYFLVIYSFQLVLRVHNNLHIYSLLYFHPFRTVQMHLWNPVIAVLGWENPPRNQWSSS